MNKAMLPLNKLSVGTKIQLAIWVNVVLAIFIGHYVVMEWMGFIDSTGVVINVLINSVIAFIYGYFVSKALTLPLLNVLARLKEINEGKGDLTQYLPSNTNDEIGELSKTFNSFIDKLHDIIHELSQTTSGLVTSVNGFNRVAQKISQGANAQTTKTQEMVIEVNKMSETVKSIVEKGSSAQTNSAEAQSKACQGGEVVRETIRGMEGVSQAVNNAAQTMVALKASSDKIGEVIIVIGNIAEQTNLLALNAAIEAARAGEQGRGFAVVADEVRALAERTSSATGEIAHMINDIQEKMNQVASTMDSGVEQVSSGAKLANDAGDTLDKIVSHSHDVARVIDAISCEVDKQSNFANTLSSHINEISEIASDSAKTVGEVLSFSDDFKDQTQSLKNIVSQFKLRESKLKEA